MLFLWQHEHIISSQGSVNSQVPWCQAFYRLEASLIVPVHFLAAERQGLACTPGLVPSDALMVQSESSVECACRWVLSHSSPAFGPERCSVD